jgi:hypothetical protein
MFSFLMPLFLLSFLVVQILFGLSMSSSVTWNLPLPADLIALNSTEGVTMMIQPTTHQTSFWTAFQHLVTQQTQTFCSIATSVTILNYIATDVAPVDPIYDPYGYWTQDTFFNDCTDKVLPKQVVSQIGSTLDQVGEMLSCHNVSVSVVKANETSLSAFRTILKETLSKGHQIAANFYRTSLGEAGGGHFSPLMAYAEATDHVLLADVARFKYPPAWVPVYQFYDSMLTIDSASGLYRGFIIVS